MLMRSLRLKVSEASTIFSILSKNFLIDEALIDTFDGVCVSVTSLYASR
jgi:hypothetical protein